MRASPATLNEPGPSPDEGPVGDSASAEPELPAPAPPVDTVGRALLQEFRATDFNSLDDAGLAACAQEFAARARRHQQASAIADPHDPCGQIVRALTAICGRRSLNFHILGLGREDVGDWAGLAKQARLERERRASATTPGPLTHRMRLPASVATGVETEPEPAGDATGDPSTPTPLAVTGTIAIVGIGLKVQNLAALSKQLGSPFAWHVVEAGHSTRVANLAKRIKRDRFAGIVIVNGRLSHKDYEAVISAARASDVPVAYVHAAGKGALTAALSQLAKRVGCAGELPTESGTA